MNPTPASSKYLEHGKKFEPVALMEYEKFMFNRTPVKVLPCGLVVSKGCPILGATPDARVVDFGCTNYFGIAEVKCPYTKYQVTPLDACTDAKFFMEQTGVLGCKLKEDHPYYATECTYCPHLVYNSHLMWWNNSVPYVKILNLVDGTFNMQFPAKYSPCIIS